MSPTPPIERTRFIGKLAVTVIGLMPQHPTIRQGFLWAVAREVPDATVGDLLEGLRLAVTLLDEQAKEPIGY